MYYFGLTEVQAHVPSQKACTTPGLPYHPPRTYFSNSSSSPILSSHDNFFSSSPMLSPASRLGYQPNESFTPNTSFHQESNDMSESAKLGIEPKNLMGVEKGGRLVGDLFPCSCYETKMAQ
ncbi:hypothetical protein LSAT2_003860 [Lamellibrachia satsuma]|nr:hypothetical protein LSAT2_003860 [Lamellibrachia satsuma]